jgi:hypothetical protein
MKHTQGEWEIHVGNYPNSYFLQTVVTDDEAEGNARLMEAAPKLLKALQALLSVAPDLPDTWNSSFDKSLRDAIVISKAAIKKATE